MATATDLNVKPDLAGIQTQLQHAATALDKVLTSPAGFDPYAMSAGCAPIPYQNMATDFVVMPLTSGTSAATKLSQTAQTTFSVKLNGGANGSAHRLGRVWIGIDAPPIANVVENVTKGWHSLGTAAPLQGISEITANGASLSGTFVVGESVTITVSGDGSSGATGTVTTVASGVPTEIAIVNGGRGYSPTGTNKVITGVTSGATVNSATVTRGDVLGYIPPTNGRMLVPAPHADDLTYNAATDNENSEDNILPAVYASIVNSIITERHTGSIVKTIGSDVSATGPVENVQWMRAQGGTMCDLAAHYTRYPVAALVQTVTLSHGTGQDPLATISGTEMMLYAEYFSSDLNASLCQESMHSYKSPYDLKVASQKNCRWRMLVPFPFCHTHEQSLPLPPLSGGDLVMEVVFKGWASIIVNSPTYNPNLTISLAPATTTTAPVSPAFPAGTYTPSLTTYTVSGGRIDTSRYTGMLSLSSTNATVVPATPLTSDMFSAYVVAEYIYYGDATYAKALKTTSYVFPVTTLAPVATLAFNSTTPTTAGVRLPLPAKMPTSHLLLLNQLNSSKLQQRVFDFAPAREPVHTTMFGGERLYGSVHNHFFDKVDLELSTNKRLSLCGEDLSRLMPSSVMNRPTAFDSGMLMFPFSAGNPYDPQKEGSISMSSLVTQDKVLTFYMRGNNVADNRYLGGLSGDSFVTTVYAYRTNMWKIDATTGMLSVIYNS